MEAPFSMRARAAVRAIAYLGLIFALVVVAAANYTG